MLAFLTAMFFLLATPGPGVLSLAGVGSAFGARAGWLYGAGLFVGSNIVMVAAALGVAALLQTNAGLRLVFVVISTAYLVYLAVRIAFAGSRIAFLEAKHAPGISGGITLQMFNPKAYAVGAFVFSNFPLGFERATLEIVVKLTLLNLCWVPIHIAWLCAGIGLRSLALRPGTQRAINIAMALAMLIVVLLAVFSNF